jgi:predicted ABC-type ATPase
MAGPSVVVLGGPNGSGKSTAAVRLLHDTLELMEFVNADVIAQGLSAFRPESVAVSAGRIMLQRLDELAESGESFALETTLASRTFAPWIESLKKLRGYRFRLVYIWLQSADLNVSRVASRVKTGGHHVPETTIRRRYYRSIKNLFDLYMPIATTWEVFDNSISGDFQLVATGGEGIATRLYAPDLWSLLRVHYDSARNQ